MDFEEFLQWFYSHFQKEKPPARSLHCFALSVADVAYIAFYYMDERICIQVLSRSLIKAAWDYWCLVVTISSYNVTCVWPFTLPCTSDAGCLS